MKKVKKHLNYTKKDLENGDLYISVSEVLLHLTFLQYRDAIMAKVELKPEHTGYLTNGQNGPILVRRTVTKIGNLNTVHVQGKDYPVQKSGAIWTTCGVALKWHVVDVDAGVIASFDTKAEALKECREQCDDDRKHAGWKSLASGYYEYNSPYHAGDTHMQTYYVGTREVLVNRGWDEAIEAFEAGREYNDLSNRYWNQLAAPTR